MFKYLQIIVPSVIAIISYTYMELSQWSEVQSALMLPLSVLAGAVLFRLARGVPELPMDELETEKIKTLVSAYQTVTRRLAWMLGVTIFSIIGLIFIDFARDLFELPTELYTDLIQFAAALVVFGVVFSFFRGLALVLGDLDYAKIQSELILTNAQQRNARARITDLNEAEEKKPHKTSPNYGRQI